MSQKKNNTISKYNQKNQSKYISPCYQTGIFSCFSVDESNVLLKDRSSSGFTSAIQPTSSGLSLWHFSKQSIFALPYLFRFALSQENRMFMYVCMYVWMNEWMNVCMYVCMHACMYVCVNPSVCVCVFPIFLQTCLFNAAFLHTSSLNVFNHLKTTLGITVFPWKTSQKNDLHPDPPPRSCTFVVAVSGAPTVHNTSRMTEESEILLIQFLLPKIYPGDYFSDVLQWKSPARWLK